MSRYTDRDILGYDNVPIEVAAEYLGIPPDRLRRILRSGTMPFLGGSTGSISGKVMYMVSPGGLVAYKNGTLLVTPVMEVTQ